MINKIQNTKNITKKEWLKLRKKGIGGSDAGAVIGVNPWKSALQVYIDKTSEDIKEIPDSERMRIGRDLEDYVAKRFEEITGKKIRRNNYILQSKEYPFMLANVDREVVGENAVLECKTTNSYAKKDWEDGKIPPYYEIQVLHYMAVAGYEKGYIAVLIGNEGLEIREIKRDEETIKFLIEIEKKFWQENVEKNILPKPDGSSEYTEAIKNKYIGGVEELINISFDEELKEEEIERYYELKDIEKDIKRKKEEIEQKIKIKMQNNEKAILGDNIKISWTSSVRKTLDTKKLKQEHEDIYNKYIQETQTRRFIITKK